MRPLKPLSESARRELDAYALASQAGEIRLRLSAGNLLQQEIVSGTEYFDDSGR